MENVECRMDYKLYSCTFLLVKVGKNALFPSAVHIFTGTLETAWNTVILSLVNILKT